MKNNSSKLVYSTAGDNRCSQCGQTLKKCDCQKSPITKAPRGAVKIFRSTKARKGKVVTVIENIDQSAEQLKQTAKRLKALCGTGGTVKEGDIEIQGDHREKLQKALLEMGIQAKISGG